jgi:hypothetical protein
MPQYMLLIYSPAEGGPSPEEMQAEMPKWWEFTQALQDEGAMVAGDALHPTDAATTVRVREGETLLTDGPFAETKEALGGYYIVDVPDLDSALKWAARIPSAPYGSVEVRPVMIFDNDPSAASQAGAQA